MSTIFFAAPRARVAFVPGISDQSLAVDHDRGVGFLRFFIAEIELKLAGTPRFFDQAEVGMGVNDAADAQQAIVVRHDRH